MLITFSWYDRILQNHLNQLSKYYGTEELTVCCVSEGNSHSEGQPLPSSLWGSGYPSQTSSHHDFPTPLPSTLQTLASGAATASHRPACLLPLLLLTLGTTAWERRVERDTLTYTRCTLTCTPGTHTRTPTPTTCSITPTAPLWTRASARFCCPV